MKQPLVWAWLIGISACTMYVEDDHRHRRGRFGDANWAGGGHGSTCHDHQDCSGDCYCSQGQCVELPFCRSNRECPDGAFCSDRLGRCVVEDAPDTTNAEDEGFDNETPAEPPEEPSSPASTSDAASNDDWASTEPSGSSDAASNDVWASTEPSGSSDAASNDVWASTEPSGSSDETDGSSASASSNPTSEGAVATRDNSGLSTGDDFEATGGAPPVDTTDGESGAVNGGSDTGAEPSTTTVDAGPACDNPEPSGDCAARPAICFSNGDCTDGLCVNAQCRSFCDESSDCPTREACVLGLCRDLDALECTVQADCPEADDCVSGSCLRRCLNDSDCELCDDGPVCRLGYCGPA